MEELPCPVEREGTDPNPEVESMWAQSNGTNYLMVIAGDINGTYEKFRQPILGGDTIHHNATYINPQFYGRVNMSASRGLIIKNVQSSDAGKFVCQYKDMKTKASGVWWVELSVFNGTYS